MYFKLTDAAYFVTKKVKGDLRIPGKLAQGDHLLMKKYKSGSLSRGDNVEPIAI